MNLKYAWKDKFGMHGEFKGIQMRRIGGWLDLCAYYAGSDGNAWAYQSGWSNCGPLDQFANTERLLRHRGELEFPMKRTEDK